MNESVSSISAPRKREAPLPLSDFAHVREERLRVTDLDMNQHVNNAAFTALLANARYDFFGQVLRPLLPLGNKLVIGTLEVSFLHEMRYGAPVFIGTRAQSFGRTSLRLEQVMYQGSVCAACSGSLWVHVNGKTKTPEPWSAEALSIQVHSA